MSFGETSSGLAGLAGLSGGRETPTGRFSPRHLQYARWESSDFEAGSPVARTRAPISAREEADPTALRPGSGDARAGPGGGCGPLGPQNRSWFSELSRHGRRPGHGVYSMRDGGEEGEEEEERGLGLRADEGDHRREGGHEAASLRYCIIVSTSLSHFIAFPKK